MNALPNNLSVQPDDSNVSSGLKNRVFYLSLSGLLVIWGILVWWFTTPDALVSDWMGWRQADTQAIALNFYHQGLNIFYPQIDWGGVGPGYVETEFQLYPAVICLGFRLFGMDIWQGQLVSLLSMMGAACYIALLCRRYFAEVPSLLGTMVFLGCLGTLHLATAVQPDALCFFFYAASMYHFSRFVENGCHTGLVVSFIFSTLAVLVKPPALHLGIVQFIWVAIASPRRLRSVALWLSWGGILAILAAYYLHANQLYVTYGNTFGIGVGGDSKFPAWADLVDPKNYYRITRASLSWGLTRAGMLACIGLLFMRRLNAFEVAASLGLGVMLVVAMRYTTYVYFGSHYHIFESLLGAYVVAHMLDVLIRYRRPVGWAACGLFFCYILVATGLNTVRRVHHAEFSNGQKYEAFAREMAAFIDPGELIVVRADAPTRVKGWQSGVNNFEDPRLFYLTATKGWVLPVDYDDPSELVLYIKQGAKFYAHPTMPMSPQIGQWLHDHATLLSESAHGLIYRLE